MNIEKSLNSLANRRSDFALTQDMSLEHFQEQVLNESKKSFSSLNEKQRVLKYLTDSMSPVSKRSTDISYEEGNKVLQHLQEELPRYGIYVEFEYQGSVINNTHIVNNSDIDLLVITKKFETLEKPQKPTNPYKGNPIEDMEELRARCIEILKSNYTVAKVDTTGSKSISISGGSLRRDIDVVPSNWFNSNKYVETGIEYYRGIQIYNCKDKQRDKNYPFWNKKLMNDKDDATYGNFKSLVRLAKNIRCDSDIETVNKISSYDIQALFYHIPSSKICYLKPEDLFYSATKYLENLINNESVFNSLMVPDQTRTIVKKMSYEQLLLLYKEFCEYEAILAQGVVFS